MSFSSSRAVAAIVAAIIAVLTGLTVALVSPSGTGAWRAAAVATVGALAAALWLLATGRGRPGAAPPRGGRQGAAPPGGGPPGAAPPRSGRRGAEAGDGAQARSDRSALIQACIYVRDRTTSAALGERLGAALREAGVDPIEPTGEPFDPAQHEAGGATQTDDVSKIGTVAAVEVPGYADRGQLLRVPVVTVYQAGEGRHVLREDQ